MTPTLLEWQRKHGITAEALADLVTMVGLDVPHSTKDTPEALVQDEARLLASKMGWRLFRNNKGVLPDKRGIPVRFGLCNETPALGKRLRSSDLIGIRPVVITPDMVGSTIGQFVAREVKKAGWKYKGTEHEVAQLAFGTLIIGLGGDFKFWNGEGEL
nr:MAG TPA: Nuclease [Caudoviricetes sp.]